MGVHVLWWQNPTEAYAYNRRHMYARAGSISASPTAWLLRGHGRAGTQNERLGDAVGDAEMEPGTVVLWWQNPTEANTRTTAATCTRVQAIMVQAINMQAIAL